MGFRSTDTDDETEGRPRADAERRVRLRVLLATYRTPAVVVLVCLLAAGAWVSYGAYAAPTGETETTRQVETTWTATGNVSHGAPVTEPTAVYPAGTRLENEPLYYSAVSPTVDGTFVGGYAADSAADVSVSLTVELVYQSVDPDNGTVYWHERESLTATNETAVQPGESVTAAFDVNVSAITARIDRIESDLGASPGETELLLVLEREIDGTIDGAERSVADEYTVPITVEDGTYRVEDGASDAYDEPYEEYETVSASPAAGPVRTLGGPVLVAVGLGGLGALAVGRRRFGEPTRCDREWLAYRDDREQFDEVVTVLPLPDAALQGPRAHVDSLAALVAYGIDVDTAIVFDPDRAVYAVRRDDFVAVFEPPRPPSTAVGDDGTGDRPGSISESGSEADAAGDDDPTPSEGRNRTRSTGADTPTAGENGRH
ncbi:DUF5305 domain-containing protein [Natrinema altunense]|uniref:DUF5305 domain-containing protein n=1 Tax=Natrinema altunense (strain JCM 12890 / CGMCC 1.3731 / AJ2) TaxID=1227494 RepID=L9ZDE9_NATA2|nr:DUF5305 domain-containing protein [Natrinema altunense]ELY84026.1 hypothetical protein C485_16295 [Natrinema altunense JCM 12890]